MKDREQMLRHQNVGSLLLKLSIPATIGMVVNALYNIVDTIFIGRGVNELAIGGLTVAFPVQMLIMAVAQMIGIGAASAISRSLGEGNAEKADTYAGNSYVLIFIISTILTIIGLLFLDPILRLFGASDTLLPYARDYMRVILIGSILFSFTVSSNNIVRAEGNAKVSMLVMIIGTGMNIILDPIFIFGFKMGISGAAIATILSQTISFIFLIFYMFSGKSMIKLGLHHLKLRSDYVVEILTIGFPSFIRQVSGSVIAIFLNNSIVHFGGDIALSAFGVINRIIMFIFMPMFGLVQGLQPIVGFNYGAKLFPRVKETIRVSIRSLVIYCVSGTLIILLFIQAIFHLFTPNPEVIAIGTFAMRIMILGIPVVGIQIISSSVFQSIGKAKPALLLSFLRQIILFLPFMLIFPHLFNLGLLGIWLAYPASDILSTLISAIMLKKEVQHMS